MNSRIKEGKLSKVWKTLFEVSRRGRKKTRRNSALCRESERERVRERLCYPCKKPVLCFACVFIFDDVITADSPSTAGSYLLVIQVTALNQSKRSSWLQFFFVMNLFSLLFNKNSTVCSKSMEPFPQLLS